MPAQADLIIVGASVRSAAFSRCGPGCGRGAPNRSPTPTCVTGVRQCALDGSFRWLCSAPAPATHRRYRGWTSAGWRIIRSRCRVWRNCGHCGEMMRQRLRRLAIRSSSRRLPVAQDCRLVPRVFSGERRGVSPTCSAAHVGLTPRRSPGSSLSARAGGVGIRFATEARSTSRPHFQEYIDGDLCAALFAATPRETRLLGVTRQLVGESWLHAGPFRYCGSVGPLSLAADETDVLVRLGTACWRRNVDCVGCLASHGYGGKTSSGLSRSTHAIRRPSRCWNMRWD